MIRFFGFMPEPLVLIGSKPTRRERIGTASTFGAIGMLPMHGRRLHLERAAFVSPVRQIAASNLAPAENDTTKRHNHENPDEEPRGNADAAEHAEADRPLQPY